MASSKINYVIVNADDFGLSRGINLGIIDAHRRGIVTSTTIMPNAPDYEFAIEQSKKNPKLGIGVHLTLTFGEPLLSRNNSLTDCDGKFHNLNYYIEEDFTINNEELFLEWDAQIQKVIQSGIKISHLDSHHHVHSYGDNKIVFEKLAKKYNLPVRKNYSMNPKILTPQRTEMNFDQASLVSESMMRPYYNNLMEDILNYSSTEIICHPGYLDKYILENSSFTNGRTFSLHTLIHSQFAQNLKNNPNVKLATFHDLRKEP